MKKYLCWLFLAVIAAGRASAQDLPRGQIIDDVQCKDDASQHYSLYLPSNFTPDRTWPVILAFDAMGRGRTGVERYQAAAEKYGYIVAGSSNSRNGPWEVSLNAARAMTTDIDKRFPVDPKRKYTAGMSGGARVAMLLAMRGDLVTGPGGPEVAGVFASSAGFPDGLHESVPFPIFGSAGTDDFNHHEMLELDATVTTPHRLEVFEGGHTWLPVELATNGVEWMEIQAMKKGLRPRDQKLIDEIFAKRVARAEAQKNALEKMRELKSIAVDFQSFKDVASFKERAAAMDRQQDVEDAFQAARAEEQREARVTSEVDLLRDLMATNGGFAKLKDRLLALFEQSQAAADSTDRRIARRVLSGLRVSSGGIRDPQFRELMNQLRTPAQPVAPPR